ncbi:IS66 Orf2 family protein [Clostridium sp. DL-VIII]|uniref:IS66 family insertion sequence element accessory protein TnpB n=1 Tax=Clostridium sp. DL-VIII TaxID=641107 RepID=UPI00023AFF64|nr:IS66 family insertion sequence element accessory protein TnpB [Clostridium sp. DL-VIII]EHJ00362.1 IS66 Orf2 family protein [Clostridium sp. DL-VIII]
MLNNASDFEKIYIACGYSDLRRGIDGFAIMVQREFKIDPFTTGILFLFCGRKTDRIKGLLWEGDGFLLLYKRLETGKFQWPRNEAEVKAISPQQYKWLMEGLSIDQKKAIKSIAPARIL